MNDERRSSLDVETIVNAFDIMGQYLRDECGLVGEIAVYGGTAILLQFPWRRMTEDVAVTILTGERESAVKDAAALAAARLELPDDWLNNYVGGFTPESESPAFFSTHGAYPRGETPGLRVFLAKPEYLCAMKLKALQRESVDDRDFEDAVNLGLEIGVDTVDRLTRLFTSFFPNGDTSWQRRGSLAGVGEKNPVAGNGMSRPQSLRGVSAVVTAGTKPFGLAIDEFLDTFYLDHPNKLRQQRRIEEAPLIVGDAFVDSWIGAVGEHLARRWNLAVPAWTRRPAHYALALPRFVPDAMALCQTLLVESPPAFRSRLLFTFVEPLQPARFPREVKRIELSADSRVIAWLDRQARVSIRTDP